MIIFAYGSLLWNPGFPVRRSVPARADGWTRSWCVESRHHRGTPARPAMVLGLVHGRGCIGMAIEPDQDEKATLAYLDAREMSEPGYSRRIIQVTLPCGSVVPAWAYVTENPNVPCGELFRAGLQSRGVSGAAAEYVARTVDAILRIEVPQGWPRPCPALPCDARLRTG